jgi:hypothetical protein
MLTRDPKILREDGNPQCLGNYEEEHYVCSNNCHKVMQCKIESNFEEQRREGKLVKDSLGRPLCFSRLFDIQSTECGYLCNSAIECGEASEEERPTRSLTSITSPKLNMYNPSSTQYTYPTFNPTYNSPVPLQSPQLAQYKVDEKTNIYLRHKYGAGLSLDPVVPGQFEGEAWYERFFKEVFKYAGYYALKLLAEIVMNTRWAPKVKEKDGK